ncbi:MAG: hypothetical protein BM558_04615 [Roseobacter sp. MedPE-SW]|nr:MAG: hypothetical protein BM558_04615 [Roseobacter sp. MedPE-SW]
MTRADTAARTEPAIALMPYGGKLGKALSERPLSEMEWPLGCPDRLLGKQVKDLAPEDHLVVFAKRAMHVQSHRYCPARISMIVAEPKIMSADHHRILRLSARRFFRVFTYDPQLLARIPNGLMLPYGTSWVPEWQELSIQKTKELSLIASAKNDHPGHKLRHQIVAYLQSKMPEAQILGRGYQAFEQKSEGLAPYRYSVVIENVQEPNYFSEKLIDAILCETVPLYWGCPNIADFFQGEGIIQCRDQGEFEAALQTIGPADYARRLPALRSLKQAAAELADLPLRAALALRDSL